MKKSLVAVLVVLAVIIIVSPGILGRMAEKSVDENLNRAAAEQGDIVVSSDSFDRGWFSSEGQHRIEVKGGSLGVMLTEVTPENESLPVLLIDTHIDHGLIPVTSLSRERGSLAPGLGRAVSTLSIELGDGETIEIPGKIYSNLGLAGALESSYLVDEGSHTIDGTRIGWGNSKIDITTSATSGDVEFAGDVSGLSFSDRAESLELGALTFSGSQKPTKYGFSVGDMQMELDGMSVTTNGVAAGGIKSMSVDGFTKLDGDRVGGRTTFAMESQTLPMFGEVQVSGDFSLNGADAEAIGNLTRKMNAMGPAEDPMQNFPEIEEDLKRLLASGVELRFDQFDVALPMGTVETQLSLAVAEDDAATFEWTSLLLSTAGGAKISVPAELVDMALAMNPQAGAMIGMGFLIKNGDVYEMDAKLEKGLLTVNGAPIPIPLGGF